MNKYLMGAALATVLAVAGTAEAKHDGFFTGAKVGYSHTTGKLNTITTAKAYDSGTATFTGANKGKGGFHGTVFVGHGTSFGKGHFAAALNASYDSSNAKVGTYKANNGGAVVTGLFKAASTETADVKYEPGFGLGLEGRGGVHFGETQKYLVFFKLGLDYNFAKLKATGDAGTLKDSVKVWSVTPGLGVQGEINDHLNWTAGVDYKLAFSISKTNVANVIKTKPKTFVVNAGLTYHF